MPRELPTDILGNKMNYRQEKAEAKNYKPDRKPWCFPFREAMKRAGYTVTNGQIKKIT